MKVEMSLDVEVVTFEKSLALNFTINKYKYKTYVVPLNLWVHAIGIRNVHLEV